MLPPAPRSDRRRAATRFAATAAAIAVTITACSGDDTAEPTEPTVDRAAIAAATVGVESTGCGPLTRFGRGTVIDDGLILTAAHSVAGSESVEVVAGDTERSTPARVVFLDPDVDVAALRVDDVTPPAVPLAPDGVDGDRPAVIAFAGDTGWDVRDVAVGGPLVIRTTDIYRGRDVERQGFKVAAAVEEGDSGSMVHQDDGGVGVIWARSNIEPEQAWAVAIPELFFDADARSSLVDAVDTGACP